MLSMLKPTPDHLLPTPPPPTSRSDFAFRLRVPASRVPTSPSDFAFRLRLPTSPPPPPPPP
eukprot:CAMPEP_0174703086 /NCGR_PEP_ID=MMETSP1094-20130205/7158_1 /TAXON_ID=156173 /ORGANISM="Chrysochromulina brevifilum, Strain UTEX LB 985" /LENGTH=60 /DNA_ID=CAMNT_0015900961 /DNA_START=406 /DNA_END=585 /DNA_ORIENTATION=+